MSRAIPEDERQRGLLALATYGNREASRRTGIAEANLRRWRDQDPVYFAELRKSVAEQHRSQAAVDAEDLAARERYLAGKALDKVEAAIDSDRYEAKDYANLLKALDVGSGIHTDKAERLRDRPDLVVDHRYNVQALERVVRVLDAIESTAEEVEPEQLPPAEWG